MQTESWGYLKHVHAPGGPGLTPRSPAPRTPGRVSVFPPSIGRAESLQLTSLHQPERPWPQLPSPASLLSPCASPRPWRSPGVSQGGLNPGSPHVLSGRSQQAPQPLISSLPRPREGQTAADKSPRGAAEGRGRPGRRSTWVEGSSSAGWGVCSWLEQSPKASGRRLPYTGL